jgi:hypothetical protein
MTYWFSGACVNSSNIPFVPILCPEENSFKSLLCNGRFRSRQKKSRIPEHAKELKKCSGLVNSIEIYLLTCVKKLLVSRF